MPNTTMGDTRLMNPPTQGPNHVASRQHPPSTNNNTIPPKILSVLLHHTPKFPAERPTGWGHGLRCYCDSGWCEQLGTSHPHRPPYKYIMRQTASHPVGAAWTTVSARPGDDSTTSWLSTSRGLHIGRPNHPHQATTSVELEARPTVHESSSWDLQIFRGTTSHKSNPDEATKARTKQPG